MKTMLIYAAGWGGMAVLAVLNGALRVKVYGPYMQELSAHQLSTFVGIILMGLYIWVFTGFFLPASSRQAFAIGSMWLIMTILFEFGFGRYLMGNPWSRLLHDYNLFKGRLWMLLLIWITIAPYVFYRIRS
ncbi:MAG: hypothetical protein AB1427_08495 [Thermodesulfobacteriota bacterium]